MIVENVPDVALEGKQVNDGLTQLHWIKKTMSQVKYVMLYMNRCGIGELANAKLIPKAG